MSVLNVMGAIHGTDKSSSHSWAWDYLRNYESIFNKWKSDDINIIEIGVASGESVATWLSFFSKAHIVGIDLNDSCLRFSGERVSIYIGSQEDSGFVAKVAIKHPPTIIIDDGSHLAHHMISSFEALFPLLAPGGCYVFEDLAFHFEESGGQWQGAKVHQGHSAVSIYEYLEPLIRARAAHLRAPKGSWGINKYVHENVDWILIIGGAAIIKKNEAREFEKETEIFEREFKISESEAEKTRIACRHAEYLIKERINADKAIELLSYSFSVGAYKEWCASNLYDLCLQAGQLARAVNAAIFLSEIDPDNNKARLRTVIELAQQHSMRELELVALKRFVQIDADDVIMRTRLADLGATL
jgi:hypothetical protein